MKKPLILGVAGVLVGVGVALAIFVFVLGGGHKGDAQAAVVATPVAFGGKLGPHITLQDRVFNLQGTGGTPVYLKVQTIVEFETSDAAWGKFAKTCAARIPAGPLADALVSSKPGVAGVALAPAEGATSPCAAEETKLLDDFAQHIGTGRQLIEDAITTIISHHTVADVSSVQGKEALKGEIKDAIEKLIKEPKVTRVLFTNFITQ